VFRNTKSLYVEISFNENHCRYMSSPSACRKKTVLRTEKTSPVPHHQCLNTIIYIHIRPTPIEKNNGNLSDLSGGAETHL
jgi:hypothetical protein